MTVYVVHKSYQQNSRCRTGYKTFLSHYIKTNKVISCRGPVAHNRETKGIGLKH